MILIDSEIYELRTFPDGTPLLTDMPIVDDKHASLTWFYDPGEEFAFFAIAHHLRQQTSDLSLFIPYVPNGRMDRVHADSECFTLHWFAELVNSVKADRVHVLDPHSPITAEQIERTDVSVGYEKMIDALKGIIDRKNIELLCFPDKGAHSKYEGLLKSLNVPSTHADKKRDWDTGKISSLFLVDGEESVKGKNVLIIDDICSYGGTIKRCLDVLDAAGAANACVFTTHTEDSLYKCREGEGVLDKKNLDTMFTTDTILHYKEHPKLELVLRFRENQN